MIYPNKPRKVDPERTKRYLARTTPDQVTTYLSADAMSHLIQSNNLVSRPEHVQMKVLFSLLMETWVKRMKIKHAGDVYRRTELYVEYEIDHYRYRFEGRYV